MKKRLLATLDALQLGIRRAFRVYRVCRAIRGGGVRFLLLSENFIPLSIRPSQVHFQRILLAGGVKSARGGFAPESQSFTQATHPTRKYHHHPATTRAANRPALFLLGFAISAPASSGFTTEPMRSGATGQRVDRGTRYVSQPTRDLAARSVGAQQFNNRYFEIGANHSPIVQPSRGVNLASRASGGRHGTGGGE